MLGKSYKQIAAELELPNAQVFYDIKAGKSAITPRIFKRIQDVYGINLRDFSITDHSTVNNGRDQTIGHVNEQLTAAILNFQDLLAKKDEQIDRLLTIIEKR